MPKETKTAEIIKTNLNHKANQLNVNRGTSGNNPANAALNGNRGKQLQSKQKPKK